MGFALNKGTEQTPVKMKRHRDWKSLWTGISCLVPFGEYTGGALILWDTKTVVELEAGDLFFFMDHLLVHSNEDVDGVRHSMVAFSHQNVFDYFHVKEKQEVARQKISSRDACKWYNRRKEMRARAVDYGVWVV